MAIDLHGVGDWLDRYVAAWESNDRAEIEGLFADDAVYYAEPYAQPYRGRSAIADAWLEQPEEPGSWSASYRAIAALGDVGVGMGTSTYPGTGGAPDRVYHNVFVLSFDANGRCTQYREWYMLQPAPPSP